MVRRCRRSTAGMVAMAWLALAASPVSAQHGALDHIPVPRLLPLQPPPLTTTAPEAPLPGWIFEEVVSSPRQRSWNFTALGVGAVGGVAAFNVLQDYFFPAAGATTTISWVGADPIAASRIFAISSAVLGAFAGQYVFARTSWSARPTGP